MIDAKQANKNTKTYKERYIKKCIVEAERMVQKTVSDRQFYWRTESYLSKTDAAAIIDHFQALGYKCDVSGHCGMYSVTISWRDTDIR